MLSYCARQVNYKYANLYSDNFLTVNSNDLSIVSAVITHWAWSPIIFDKGIRRQENFMRADWIALDFDDPEPTLDEIKRTVCDMIHIIGTTKSHQKLKKNIICDRFRLLLRLDEPILDYRQYVHLAKKLTVKFESDPACVDAARFFWPCSRIVSEISEGYTQEIIEMSKDEIDRADVPKGKDEDDTLLSSYVLNIINNGFSFVDTGKYSRNSICFRAACELARKNMSYARIYNFLYRKIPDSKDFDEKERAKIVLRALKEVKK